MQPVAEAPVAFAGHSLGQVTALIAAGSLPFDEGVRFAARRAELTQAAADAHPGRMAALLGRDARAGRGRVRGRARRVLGRERQRTGPGRDRGHSRGARAGFGAGEGARRQASHSAQRGRRVPHTVDARREHRAGGGIGERCVRATDGAGRVEPRRSRLLRRRRLARPARRARVRAGALALDHDHARRRSARARSAKSGTVRCSPPLAKRGAPDVVVQKISAPDDITPERTNPDGIPTKLEVG